MSKDINMICIVSQTLETMDMGKPFATAVDDMMGAARWLRYSAGWVDKICGETPPVDGPYFTYTRLEPVGVCGFILPVRVCLANFHMCAVELPIDVVRMETWSGSCCRLYDGGEAGRAESVDSSALRLIDRRSRFSEGCREHCTR